MPERQATLPLRAIPLLPVPEKNDMTLIAVVLNGHQTHYSDTKALFDFGFDRFQAVKGGQTMKPLIRHLITI